jgi:hypothetical protein
MAKKKIKKPVSKRVKKTDIPKVRKPRVKKPKSVVTTEPAIKTVWSEGSVNDFLADVGAVPTPVPTHADTPLVPPVEEVRPYTHSYIFSPPVEYTKVNKNFIDSAWEWINFKLDDAKVYWKKHNPITAITDFAFAHPLFFAIVFSTAVLIVVLAFGIAARIFGW